MNRIVLVGNGFDLAHGLKTKYENFLNWYWDVRTSLNGFGGFVPNDSLCAIESRISDVPVQLICAGEDFQNIHGFERYEYLKNCKDIRLSLSPFFEAIHNSIKTQGWVDIENEYYKLLIEYSLRHPDNEQEKNLNEQLRCLQNKLVDYLSMVNKEEIKSIEKIKEKIYESINIENDISIGMTEARIELNKYISHYSNSNNNDLRVKLRLFQYNDEEINRINSYKNSLSNQNRKELLRFIMLPDNILLLSFNYTKTVEKYLINGTQNSMIIYIHGTVEEPSQVIFGYGDELHEDYKKLQELNEKECLSYVKSIKYMETDNYRNVLRFIESAPYQVCIMGHSCGNSDRTLLNTLFEHKNCISIKPYYYKKEDGSDNDIELIQNISRNFSDMKLMRDRVVNKAFCQLLKE